MKSLHIKTFFAGSMLLIFALGLMSMSNSRKHPGSLMPSIKP